MPREIFKSLSPDVAWGATLSAGAGEIFWQNPRIHSLLASSPSFSENNTIAWYLLVCAGIGAIAGTTHSAQQVRKQITYQLFEAEIALRMLVSDSSKLRKIDIKKTLQVPFSLAESG